MKPAAFAYSAPASEAEALALLADLGRDGTVLAGGQSLIPLLNMRLAHPAHLVDINGIAELDVLDAGPDGVRVGAGVRHARLERDAAALATCPLLADAMPLVAHPVIRNRGTVCGSIAHGDPAGELTAVLALLGGSVRLAHAEHDGTRHRDLPAAAFFVAPLETAKHPGELVESVWFPAAAARTGSAFAEVSRRHGDYALCGVGASVTLDADGRVTDASAAYLSVAPVPLVVDLGEALAGQRGDALDTGAAARLGRERVDPEDDIHATAAYRRHLAGVLTERVLRTAARRAGELR